MATVYKIEIEAVSSWVNYTPKQIKEMVEKALDKIKLSTQYSKVEEIH